MNMDLPLVQYMPHAIYLLFTVSSARIE